MNSTEIRQTAEKMYPTAVLYLGSREQARAAVIEAFAAALRKSPSCGEKDVLVQLLRICQSRAPERVTETDLSADSPLLPLLKLPVSGRRNLSLHLSDFGDETVAEVRQISPEEFAQKTEKAMRQLTFLQGGTVPDPDALRQAFRTSVWSEEDHAALTDGLAAAEQQNEPAAEPAAAVHDISHKKTAGTAGKKTVAVPLWAVIALGLCIAVLCVTVVLTSLLRNRTPEHPALPAESEETADVDPEEYAHIQSSFLTLDQAQETARKETGVSETDAVFISTKLKPTAEPPYYEIDLLDGAGQEYLLKLHAEQGDVLESQQFKADHTLDTDGWLSADALRKQVLDTAGLKDALFLKEKWANDGTLDLCKYELTDAHGRLYTVQLEAKSGALVKYSVEEPQSVSQSDMITLEQAKQKALSRVGDYEPDQVIFTKTKFEGRVYMIAFTLDDGTQYTIELNAADGMTNTVDVHPVSADTSHAIGLLRARDIVLEKAGLTDDETVRFTKAKVDRNNGAYVYELEFENSGYEYEVSLKIDTGEMIKYRAWSLT